MDEETKKEEVTHTLELKIEEDFLRREARDHVSLLIDNLFRTETHTRSAGAGTKFVLDNINSIIKEILNETSVRDKIIEKCEKISDEVIRTSVQSYLKTAVGRTLSVSQAKQEEKWNTSVARSIGRNVKDSAIKTEITPEKEAWAVWPPVDKNDKTPRLYLIVANDSGPELKAIATVNKYEDALRILACLNFCAKFSTESIENTTELIESANSTEPRG